MVTKFESLKVGIK